VVVELLICDQTVELFLRVEFRNVGYEEKMSFSVSVSCTQNIGEVSFTFIYLFSIQPGTHVTLDKFNIAI
jgi:hypothetical protein